MPDVKGRTPTALSRSSLHCRKLHGAELLSADINIHLEVSPLVESVRRPEQRHLPHEHVLVVDELDAESLHRILVQTLVLEGEGADRAGAGCGGHPGQLWRGSCVASDAGYEDHNTIWFAINSLPLSLESSPRHHCCTITVCSSI